jgi:REP element-mobilizing transposase RayT
MATRPRRKRIRLENAELYRQDGRVFLVTLCTRAGKEIFADVDFGRRCVELLAELRRARDNPVFAYCLMPDHVHLVVGVHEGSSLPAFVQAWKSLSTREWRQRGGSRTFWQRSFHDRAQRQHEHLQATCLYVLANPVRKGLVREWREYPLCGSLEWEL